MSFLYHGGCGRIQRDDQSDGANNWAMANPRGAAPVGLHLTQEDFPLVNASVGGIFGVEIPNARFQETDDMHVAHAPNLYVRYKLRTLGAAERATVEARRYVPGDLRKVEHFGLPVCGFYYRTPRSPSGEFAGGGR